jgi:hypothetical protein
MSETQTFTLSSDAAVVLFECLAREVEDRKGVRLRRIAESESELWALRDLHAALEAIIQPAAGGVDGARARLLTRNGGPWPHFE